MSPQARKRTRPTLPTTTPTLAPGEWIERVFTGPSGRPVYWVGTHPGAGVNGLGGLLVWPRWALTMGEPWVYLTWDHAWTLDASLAVRQDSRGRVMTRRLQLERWPYPSGSLLRVR